MSETCAAKLGRLSATDAATIAVAGCSKNAGKTTAMNVLTATWAGQRVGLMSIGIDGEDADFWLGVPKPRIAAGAGTIFATAERTLQAASCHTEILERTGISTPLGELIIARTLDRGLLLLAGIRHKADVRAIRDRMTVLGARRIVIDGAYQRLMSADPEISDALILATGAILGTTAAEVADKTSTFVDRIRLPGLNPHEHRELLDGARATGLASILTTDGNVVTADAEGVAGALDRAAGLAGSLRALAMPGAIPAGFLDGLQDLTDTAGSRGEPLLTLVIQDATRLFAGGVEFRRFLRKGHSIVVGRAIRLLALAVNPISVTGGMIPSGELISAIESSIQDVPVIDFVAAAGEAADIR